MGAPRTMDEIPSARMAYSPGLAWVMALLGAGIILVVGVGLAAAGLVAAGAVSAVIGVLFAVWGASLWRRWFRGRRPMPEKS